MNEVVKLVADLPPHLETLVIGATIRGAYICVHHRQLSICAVCAPEAERLGSAPYYRQQAYSPRVGRPI